LTVGGDSPFLPALLAAINHASEISIATAFIRMTGFRLIEPALMDALARGAAVRLLTGDYLGITEPSALRHLLLLVEKGADVRVFESGGVTSFHMKAYLFTRQQHDQPAEGCIFVGSSNLSKAALQDGLEWNLRIDQAENTTRFAVIYESYETLFSDSRCKTLTHQWIDDYQLRVPAPSSNPVSAPGAGELLPPPMPNEVQQSALVALAESRNAGYQRGLVVMATGLGKTWLAAFDSRQINAKRLLFVAHREEILDQAESTFVQICPDLKVGRYSGKEQQLNVDMLFASVQTLGKSQHLAKFPTDYFDYVVVDEFHHAAATTYQRLLRHFTPRFLLGLTATPDRTDQADILSLCDDNLVYQQDLFDGIEAQLLCPFHYQGIADTIDYQAISWRNGRFDPEELVNQLATQARAKHNFAQWKMYKQTRTLAFCMSMKHADFMAAYFEQRGVKAVSVHSQSTTHRSEALDMLKRGEIDVIFSVDLFNEGVDLPTIDTILMLRPTESKIIFLQQLGRGLRTSPASGKNKLVVLDFIGNHISFFRKVEALFHVDATGDARRQFILAIEAQALDLPPGCFANYDLQSIDIMKSLIGTRVDIQVTLYHDLKLRLGHRPSIAEFYRGGGQVNTVRREAGQWFQFVGTQADLIEEEQACLEIHAAFFVELETTALTKCFKLILIEALLELDGFQQPPSASALALKSYDILQRRRHLLTDLPAEYSDLDILAPKMELKWRRYWRSNPINAWIGGNTATSARFFSLNDNHDLCFQSSISTAHNDVFELMVRELLHYRYLQYEARYTEKTSVDRDASPANQTISLVPQSEPIPYFTDLKIACGHFQTSDHETDIIEYRSIPLSFGKVDAATHFIARAKGNSMNGGSTPIRNGDHLLLELTGSTKAGSLNSQIVVIEQQDVAGDDQYLLRKVQKVASEQYELIALNPDYEPLAANEEMRPIARLRALLPPEVLYLHQAFMREDIPPLFGLEFNTGLWQSGHVCPKDSNDQYLLVTLNKQGHAADHHYHDYFVDAETFHWQSQNSTTPAVKKGKAVVGHVAAGSNVHLFVRNNKLQSGKAAPFTYCGTMDYVTHTGEAPMSVTWCLTERLSEEVLARFSLAS
jgi:superfamily II DNA or RNA helicase/SOS-response transcriptional repressor LexA